jgi:hypothetical protein
MTASPLTLAADLIPRMTTLKERLEELMREMVWNEHMLVQQSGASRSAVAQWLGKGSKEIKSIKLEYALKLEESTDGRFAAKWIAHGTGPKRTSAHHIPRQDPDAEQVAVYAAMLALLTSHPDPVRLLDAFDGVVSAMTARGELREPVLAALQRLRAQLVRQVEAGKRPNLR